MAVFRSRTSWAALHAVSRQITRGQPRSTSAESTEVVLVDAALDNAPLIVSHCLV
jgi:hypothetical protein